MRLEVWDVGGQKAIRSHWSNFFQGCAAVIFVVDSADHKRIEEAALALF
jgi:GTPase SAR1 family protein